MRGIADVDERKLLAVLLYRGHLEVQMKVRKLRVIGTLYGDWSSHTLILAQKHKYVKLCLRFKYIMDSI